MSSSAIDKFSHRQNEDGTVDSICHFCFATIATMESEDALDAFEKAHVCDENDLQLFCPIQK
jgi:hypothetical protein